MPPAIKKLRAAMAQLNKRQRVGALVIAAAALVLLGAWLFAGATDAATDNAYVRGDVTSIAARVGGYVTSVEVADNQSVEVGDILVRIDDTDYRARLAQATANVAAAEARVRNADAEIDLQHSLIRQSEAQRRAAIADLNLATSTNDRRRELIRRNFISPAAVDESEAQRARASEVASAAAASVAAQRQRVSVLVAQREAAVAALAQAEATRDLAEIDLANTILRAPIRGVVGNRQVRLGRLVAPGAPLLDIVPVQELWVVANFKETQLEGVRPGQRVRIRIDGYRGQTFIGVVDSLAPGSGSAFSLLPADNATGNFVRVVQRVPVKIRFAEGQPRGLVPGMSARVRIHVGDR